MLKLVICLATSNPIAPFQHYFFCNVKNKIVKLLCWRTGALVKWLWEMTHFWEVVGSNPRTIYWMDMTFFHIDWIVYFKRPKINKKEPGFDPWKKYNIELVLINDSLIQRFKNKNIFFILTILWIFWLEAELILFPSK